MKKIILISCLLLLAVAIVCFYFSKLSSTDSQSYTAQSENHLAQKQAEDALTITPPSSKETDGWKIYRNDRYKYSIKYPDNWYIETTGAEADLFCLLSEDECDGGNTIISNYPNPLKYYEANHSASRGHNEVRLSYPDDYQEVNIEVAKTKLVLDDYITKKENGAGHRDWNITKQVIKQDGKPGIKTVVSKDSFEFMSYYVSGKNYIYSVGADNIKEVEQKIMSTFKITD